MPLLPILLAGSGCAALIYEIVWYQLLQLAIGSTAVSLGVLLATFMGGLCMGSLGMARLGGLRQHPLRLFAIVEAGIAVCGILVLFGFPYIDRIYIAGAAHGLPGMLLRGFIAAVCLLPPTILMGASLPAISRWIESTPSGASWWGFLYGANTAGAVFGCLLAGFYLLRLYNTATATYVAASHQLDRRTGELPAGSPGAGPDHRRWLSGGRWRFRVRPSGRGGPRGLRGRFTSRSGYPGRARSGRR